MAKRLLEGPATTKGSALKGNLVIDATRGVIRVRSWPKKRGKPRSQTTIQQNQWFKDCLALIKKMEPGFLAQMMVVTKGTNMYPRDLAMQILSGRHCLFIRPDGTKMFPEVYMMDVSLALDSIAQLPGMMLFRGADTWIAVPAGLPGQVLQFTSPTEPPEWVNPGGSAAGTRYGTTGLSWAGSQPMNPGRFYGMVYTSPAAFIADAIVVQSRTTVPTTQLFPAIYAVGPTGILGARLADGPATTGVVPGDNVIPLTAPLAIAAGQRICFGASVAVAAVDAPAALSGQAYFFNTAGAPPNPAPVASTTANNWQAFALRVQAA